MKYRYVFVQPLQRVLAGEKLDDEVQALYVLTGGYVQKWAVNPNYEKVCHFLHYIKGLLTPAVKVAAIFRLRLYEVKTNTVM